MKKIIYPFLISLFLMIGCDDDDSSNPATRNVVSENETISFEELLILINIKASDSSFLVVESIDSVDIYINSQFWSKTNSQSIDTSKVGKFVFNNEFRTDDKVNYLINAGQTIEETNFTTAGEFADFLNSNFDLEPGEYACFIKSFQLTFNDNTIKTYYPQKYKTFKVEQNSRSAYVGEIELKID